MSWRVGVDSGGTFTDVCLFDEAAGGIHVWKVPSTPRDPSEAIANGIERALEQHGEAPVAYFGHGTTVATNALIQGRGVATGLITTEGFRDLLEIARQKRPSLYDLQCDKPEPLVPRRRRLEVAERVRHDGRIETPLDENALRTAAWKLKEEGVEAVAVGFLYAFVDPSHERRARAILEEVLPEAFVSCSHEVALEFREFERLSTVVVNATLGPVMSVYIERLKSRLAELEITCPPHITQSNGGIITLDRAARQPVRTLLSGPSTGVVGAIEVGRVAGAKDLITFDMGGTSTDVALIDDGRPTLAAENVVQGYPIKAPMLDINTVGAGGGSLAFIDSGDLLKVGPRSAGADPGPVCYGLGNTEPTVTDANVVLGVLNPTHLLGGRMPIDQELALQAITRLGERLGLPVMDTAQGIISIVTATMAKAIRVISVQRGYDLRDFALVAFGGAGPIHAARLARDLELKQIIVPPHPGILCAIGLLLTDLRTNYARTPPDPARGRLAGRDGEHLRRAGGGCRCLVRARRDRDREAAAAALGRHALCGSELRAGRTFPGRADHARPAAAPARSLRGSAPADVWLHCGGGTNPARDVSNRGRRRRREGDDPILSAGPGQGRGCRDRPARRVLAGGRWASVLSGPGARNARART